MKKKEIKMKAIFNNISNASEDVETIKKIAQKIEQKKQQKKKNQQ